MSYDEEQQKRSRVVVETPTARREESYTSTTRNPDRGGYSTGMIATIALVAVAATALLMFFLLNRGDATNSNTNVTVTTAPTPLTAAPPPPVIIQQPAQQTAPQPIIVQAPPTTTQPAPIIVSPPAPAATTSAPAPPDDAGIESRIGRVYSADPDLKDAGITVTVINGQVTLIGSVKTVDLKTHAERLANGIKGVKSIDSKITIEGMP